MRPGTSPNRSRPKCVPRASSKLRTGVSAKSPANCLEAGLERIDGLSSGPEQVEKLLSFLDVLVRWNRAYNLTAVKDPLDMVPRHLLDSLALSPWLEDGRLLDAGSGGGFPGVPLAIARPGLEVTLLDSAGKKTRFLNHVRRALELPNVEVVQARLEHYACTEGFDAVVSRAFSDLAAFAAAARHLVAGATRLYAMKGRYPEPELQALPAWVKVETIEKLAVPGLQEDRHLVIMSVNA